MNMTLHAQQRMQQRGINRDAFDMVLSYGRASHDNHGCQVIWLDKRCRKRIGREEGKDVLRKLDKHLNTYLVMSSDGTIITVGHHYKRIMWH